MGGRRRALRPVRNLLFISFLVFQSSPAFAHNFVADPGVDHWTEVRILDDRVVITYATYLQEGAAMTDLDIMDLDKDGDVSPQEEDTFKTMMLSNLQGFLSLTIDGQPVDLNGTIDFHSLRARRYNFLADLPTLPPGEHRLAFYDGTFLALPGQLKTSLIEAGGARVLDWTIPEERPLPTDPKEKALVINSGRRDERTITIRYRTEGARDGVSDEKRDKERIIATTLGKGSIRERLKDLINNPRWSVRAMAMALLIAFVLGAAHALTPGHGKAIVAAYLVGTKGRVWDAIFLGGIVTITHTFSVFMLGLGMLYASQYVVPQTLFPWLMVLSGALVAGMGIWLLVRRLSSASGHSHGHDHAHHHDHGHDHVPAHAHSHGAAGHHTHGSETPHTHKHTNASGSSLGSLVSLGISGGLIPCPEALVVLLITIALNRIALGLVVLVSFSLGLASVLVTVGILLVVAKPLMARFTGGGKVLRILPVASAAIVTLLGCGIAVKGLMQAGIL
jgi:ABC-type nickel/cobalt efflux system permease component RcnA